MEMEEICCSPVSPVLSHHTFHVIDTERRHGFTVWVQDPFYITVITSVTHCSVTGWTRGGLILLSLVVSQQNSRRDPDYYICHSVFALLMKPACCSGCIFNSVHSLAQIEREQLLSRVLLIVCDVSDKSPFPRNSCFTYNAQIQIVWLL